MPRLFLRVMIIMFLAGSIHAQSGFPLETIVQKGHSGKVNCTAFSPDGKYIATGSADNTLVLWNRANGKEIRIFTKHTSSILSSSFSPDGKFLLSASKDNTAVIFDILTGKVVHVLENKKDDLRKAVFSPDGSKVLSMTNRDEMQVWDVHTGKSFGIFKKSFAGEITPLWFSPDGTKLIVYGNYKSAKVVDIGSGQELLKLDFEKTFSAAWSPDGKYIVLGSNKLHASVYDAISGKELAKLKDDENLLCDGCNTKITISKNSKFLLTGSKKAGVTLWDIRKGQKIRTFSNLDSRLKRLHFSPDGKYIAVASDREVHIYHTQTAKLLLKVKNGLLAYYELKFSPDSRFVLVPSANNTTTLWNLANGKKQRIYSGYLNKQRDDGMRFSQTNWTDVNILRNLKMKVGIELSPSANSWVRGSVDSTVLVMDMATGKTIHNLQGHRKVVFAYAYSPDGKILATAGGDAFIILWNVKTGKEIRRLKGHHALIFDLEFSRDGKNLVSGSWDPSMIIWDVESGNAIRKIPFEGVSPYEVGFTPNGLYAVSGDLKDGLKLWEVDSGKEFRSLIGHTHVVSSFDFSPDGKRMVSGSWDGKVKIWDLLTGMLLGKMEHPKAAVLSVAWDPKGRWIASGSNDRTIQLWDAETGANFATLKGHLNAVSSLHFTPDGTTLISCDVEGVVKYWDLSSQKERFTHIQIDRDNWLVRTTEGYFDGSARAQNLVNYVSGLEVLPVASFFDKFYTPGLLQRLMAGERFGDAGKNINELIKGSLEVELLISASKKRAVQFARDSIYNWRDSLLPLRVNVYGNDSKPEQIRIYNNGKLIVNEEFAKEIVFRSAASAARSFEIPLADGRNHLRAVVVNQEGTESLPSEIRVDYDGEAALTDLYILAIGINAYKNPSYKLNFAVNDAKSFSKSIRKGADTLFHSVNEYFIKDKDASKAKIAAIFAEIKGKAGPEDVFLFYYAGHGVMSAAQDADTKDFYLVPYDVTNLYGDPEQLRNKAISALELMEFSRQIPAEKQLFVLDACQSGGALNAFAQRGASREKALAQLARSTGTFFLTASQDIQYANESGNLGHGLFTYALLEALEGKADGGSNDMKITVNELKTYVEERVPELAQEYNGPAQYPTSYSFGQDFPIVIVK